MRLPRQSWRTCPSSGMRVSQRAPEPKPVLKARLRAQIAKLAADAKPTLRAERGKAEVAVFRDREPRCHAAWGPYVRRRDLCLARFPERDGQHALDSPVDDALPDDSEAMTEAEQREELAKLDAEIDGLERSEESLVVEAFSRGVDVLRRANASPCQPSLGVRLASSLVAGSSAAATARRQRA